MKKVQDVKIKVSVTTHTTGNRFKQDETGAIRLNVLQSRTATDMTKSVPIDQVLTVIYEDAKHWGVVFADNVEVLYLIAKDVAEVVQEVKGIWQKVVKWWNDLFGKKPKVPVYPRGKFPTNPPLK